MRQCRRSLKRSTADFWYQTHKVLDVTSESMHVIDETSPSSPNHALELFLNGLVSLTPPAKQSDGLRRLRIVNRKQCSFSLNPVYQALRRYVLCDTGFHCRKRNCGQSKTCFRLPSACSTTVLNSFPLTYVCILVAKPYFKNQWTNPQLKLQTIYSRCLKYKAKSQFA